MEKDITIKPKTHPALEGLSDYLKDPANFEDVQRKIINSFITDCKHQEVIEWIDCKKCTKKMVQRRKLLKELGFKNAFQYMMWKRVHTTIRERMPLVNWKEKRHESS